MVRGPSEAVLFAPPGELVRAVGDAACVGLRAGTLWAQGAAPLAVTGILPFTKC